MKFQMVSIPRKGLVLLKLGIVLGELLSEGVSIPRKGLVLLKLENVSANDQEVLFQSLGRD